MRPLKGCARIIHALVSLHVQRLPKLFSAFLKIVVASRIYLHYIYSMPATAGPDGRDNMTQVQQNKIIQAIAECSRYIEKEQAHRADLRPADVAQHLEFCIQHRAKLQAMLAAD
jgi:hypothetical protein